MVDSNGDPQQKLLADALRAVQALRQKVESLEAARTMPIAVVGIGCRLPGNVHSARDYWALLENGVDAVGDIPPARWSAKERESDARIPALGAFLNDVDSFDPTVFRMAPREAMYLDPQQRLLLESAWEALENASISPQTLQDSTTGVFIGIASFDYGLQMASRLSEPQIDASTTTGIFHSPAAGRLSYVLGLRGPSVAIDTACSSSLVAIHLACESLRRNECNMALVGGVNLMLAPLNHISTARAQMLSPEGRCKTFSESANGYGRGEGCGMVVLKRLSDALASKDRILAVIRGSAVNQDGASGGLTVPSGPAQEEVIRKALSAAGMDPSAIHYIEAHGTGTALGDPIEVNALGEVFAKSRDASRPLWIGSCKTNIGHLEPAAGIVGFLKVVLQLHHGAIAPSLHFDRPNSRIAWNELPFRVPTESIPWRSESGKKRAAGVSSFGFSGTNAHVVLEEAPHFDPPQRSHTRSLHLFVLSARSKAALMDLARTHAEHLERNPGLDIGDVCHSANAGRAQFEHRLAVAAPSIAALRETLSRSGREESSSDAWKSIAAVDGLRVGFIFPAVGHWQLQDVQAIDASEVVFARALDSLAAVLTKETGWSLRELLTASDDRTTRIEYALPVHYCLQTAFVSLWRSWGVIPAHVFGYDAGEYAAACAGGIFTPEEGLRLVVAQARYLQAVRESADVAMVARLGDEVAKVATQIRYGAPQLEIISAESRLSQSTYWANPDRDTWSLQRGTDALVAAGAQMHIEMGPACAGWPLLLEKLALAYVAGQRVDWNGFSKNTWATKLALPTYVFQRRPHWFPCKLAFVFSGQGSQWAGMGKTLLADQPVFREAMERCDRALQREAGFSILEEIAKDENNSRMAETVVAQVALFAIEASLAALLQSWGVRPELVIGHSVGEIAAAYVAGILDMEDAARIVALRARIMQKATGHGRMIAVTSTETTALGLLAGFEARVGIAAVNDPGHLVLSGDIEAIDAIIEQLSARGIEYRDVPVDYAFHSPQMEPLRDEFVATLGSITPRAGTIPMWSTVTGDRIRGESLDAAYWGRNIRQTVRFSQAVNQAVTAGALTFIEVGPHAVLSKNLEEILSGQDAERRVFSTLRRHKDEHAALLAMMEALGPGKTQRSGLVRRDHPGHPLLGSQRESSINSEHSWERKISAKTPAYLDEHRVQGEVVFPGTGYLEMAHAAGATLLNSTALTIEATSFEQMLTLPNEVEKTVQLVMTEQGSGQWAFHIASRTEGTKTWVKHAHGTVRRATGDTPTTTSNVSPHALAEKAGETPSVAE
ncbi:MAG TPA: acyltransferase domain-containing protein, partial [Polyangium sp.]|nr:acyltransferase domain-containing protein [Polyangium sp.]